MHPGDIVAGKYRVANVLGRSRGLLLEARHTEFDQRVIIRLLSPHLCDDKQVEQFRREARTLSKLESEHVARIIDVGTHSDGSFFLVRQYLEGYDVHSHIRQQGALRLEEAVLYILQASEAVQECHAHSIILRELQPSHLFISRKRGGTPLVKLIDFGTAKIMKDPAAEVAVNGEMTATVMFGMSPYSSPELVRKVRGIDGRTDVWSLGCILYEMLAAVPPFQGEMAELMLRITREEPIPLSNLRPDLPREFDQIIGWALAKERDSRFSSVYAFAHALKAYASPEGQVLIDQIGRLAHSKPEVKADTKISPTSPLAKRPGRYDAGEDATVMRASPSQPSMAPSSQPGYGASGHPPRNDESPFEKTTFLPDADRASQPPPMYTAPGMSAYPDRGSVPPPMRPRQGSWIEPDPVAAGGLSANATGGYPMHSSAGDLQRSRQRKMAVLAIGAALVLLPVLVVVLIFALRPPTTGETVALNAPAAKPLDDTAPTKPAADRPDTPIDSTPAPTPAPNDVAPASSGQEAPAPAPQAGPQPGGGTMPGPTPKPTPRDEDDGPAPKPDPEPKEQPKSSGGGQGTLVAIAIGGSCAFSVDGAPKGTKSSLRIKVPVGSHSVSCAPPGKATRSQQVVVSADKPGIASFKLN